MKSLLTTGGSLSKPHPRRDHIKCVFACLLACLDCTLMVNFKWVHSTFECPPVAGENKCEGLLQDYSIRIKATETRNKDFSNWKITYSNLLLLVNNIQRLNIKMFPSVCMEWKTPKHGSSPDKILRTFWLTNRISFTTHTEWHGLWETGSLVPMQAPQVMESWVGPRNRTITSRLNMWWTIGDSSKLLFTVFYCHINSDLCQEYMGRQ